MKRIILILTLLAGASLFLAAQDSGRRTGVVVGLGTGINLGLDGLQYDERETSHRGSGYAMDAYVGGFFTEAAGLRAGWQGLSISDRYTDFGSLPYNYIHGDLLLRPHKNIILYGHAGYVKVVNPSFGLGAGLILPIHLGKHLSIVTDLRATGYNSRTFAVKERNVAATVSGTIGLSYRFGSRGRQPEPAVEPLQAVPVEPVVTVVHDTVTVTVTEFVNTTTVVRDTVYLTQPADTVYLHPESISALAMFDSGKSDLRKEAYHDLDRIVAWFSIHPKARGVIEGHTDNQASLSYNQALSERRAKAVYDYLVSHGVEASRLSWVGYGPTRPVAANDTAEGRQRNRRIEIHVEEE